MTVSPALVRTMLTCMVSVLLAGLPRPAAAVDPAVDAAKKARLLLTLTRFAQWPGTPAPGEPLRLCVAQRSEPVLRSMLALQGQSVNGRAVVVQQKAPWDNCHVLYIHASAEGGDALPKSLADNATLTVGDAAGFINQGGMVQLLMVNDALHFDVDLGAVHRARLGLSSQAMNLARRVRN
jgi:hypothetical protein